MDHHASGKSPEPAIGAGDHAFAPDYAGVAQYPIAHQLGMLDQNRRMGDDAGDQNLVLGQIDMAPYLPFVLVTRISSFERISAGADLENDVDDILELHVIGARAHIDRIAGVETNLLLRDTAERPIEGFDAQLRPFAAVLERHGGVDDVLRDQARIVDL